jgi:hypothetical protein
MKKKVLGKALKARAKALQKPLYARPKDLAKYQQTTALRAQHIAQQERTHNRNEYDRVTGFIHSTVHPGLRADLVRERSKLL